MRRATLVAGLALLLGAATGCGDPPRVVVRDTLTQLNELCDSLVDVNDEKTAGDFLNLRLETLTKKYEKIRTRQQDFFRFDKDQKKELAEDITRVLPEGDATGKRLEGQLKRIGGIANQLLKKATPTGKGRGAASVNPQEVIPNLYKLTEELKKTIQEIMPSEGDTPKAGKQTMNPLEKLKPKLPPPKAHAFSVPRV
jgi:hypothetical protein